MNNIVLDDKEFTFKNIPALPASRLLLKIQKKVIPIFADSLDDIKKDVVVKMQSDKKSTDENEKLQNAILDIDISKIFKVISENINEDVIEEILIPLFELCDLRYVVDKKHSRKLHDEEKINFVFSDPSDILTLIDLTKYILEVQFGDFLPQLLSHFGLLMKEDGQEMKTSLPQPKLAK